METTNSPVIFVTEEKKRRRGLLWVGAAAAALLVGGSTFALWSAEVPFGADGQIVSGDLNMEKVGSDDTTFYDVSEHRTDANTELLPGIASSPKGHKVDLTTWQMVPGDTIAAVFPVTVTLEGDNMVAKLSVDTSGVTGTGSLPIDWTYGVYRADGTQAFPTGPLPADGVALYLAAEDVNGPDDSLDSKVEVVTKGVNDTFTVVVYGTFDESTPNRDHVLSAAQLAGIALKLEQVREIGHGAFA
ncbi:MAG: alternate-type signal peptide domain-containing protein [Micrococcales bacterium]|nr:alternate-type signal peptide domain-containing protein [Micrococcales bacterium]